MNAFNKSHVIAVLAALTAFGCAQDREFSGGNQGDLSETRPQMAASLEALRFVISANRASSLFRSAGPSVSCSPANTVSNPCMIDAKIQELFTNQQVLTACAIQTSNITISNAHYGDKIYLQWNLSGPDPATPPTLAKYKFEQPQGLLITKDDDDSTKKKAESATDNSALLMVKYKKSGGEVDYYPLVEQTQTSGVKFLCGAGDPVIFSN